MTQDGFAHPLRFAAAKAELERGVAVFLVGFLLDDRAGSRLDNGHRNQRPLFYKNLTHAQFAADEAIHSTSLLKLDFHINAGG